MVVLHQKDRGLSRSDPQNVPASAASKDPIRLDPAGDAVEFVPRTAG